MNPVAIALLMTVGLTQANTPSEPAPSVPVPSTNLIASNPLRWAKVKISAGELKVKLDANLRTPVVQGQAQMRSVGNDIEITPQAGAGVVVEQVGSIEVRLPRGWGLEVASQSAEIQVEGVAFLKGRVATGDVQVKAVEGLDLVIDAGNLEGSLLLRGGQHRLRVSTGSANLRLLPGSSVKLSPTVRTGSLSTEGFRRVGNILQLGDGRASLSASVNMGDLSIAGR